MGYAIIGGLFLLTTIACFLWTALRRREPDADSLSIPSPGETAAGFRKNHLFSCYLAGNDASPSIYCPFDDGSPESVEWIAGWTLASRGIMVDGREKRRENPSCKHPGRQPSSD